MIEGTGVFMSSPFTDRGSIADMFGSDTGAWLRIRSSINSVSRDANTAG